MATQLDICNMALDKIGVNPIASLQDNSNSAAKCALYYTTALNKALWESTPSFATTRIQLALLNETPLYGFSYTYSLPANVVRCLEINEDQYGVSITSSGTTAYDAWRKELDPNGNTVILANVNPLQMKVIVTTANTGNYDPGFIELMAVLLASYLAFSLRADMQRQQALQQEYSTLLNESSGIDSSQGSHDKLQASAFTEVR